MEDNRKKVGMDADLVHSALNKQTLLSLTTFRRALRLYIHCMSMFGTRIRPPPPPQL